MWNIKAIDQIGHILIIWTKVTGVKVGTELKVMSQGIYMWNIGAIYHLGKKLKVLWLIQASKRSAKFGLVWFWG